MKTILCIDGGGMCGMIPAMVLEHIERHTGIPIHESFDLIYGTSIGGIATALLGAGKPAADLVDFFSKHGPAIFTTQFAGTEGIIKPRYAASGIESALAAELGSQKLNASLTRIGITSFDLVRQKPYFFKSFEPGDWFSWQAGRATSAAETYFPAFKVIHNEPGSLTQIFWDGGNVANNPAVCAYADAVKLWGDEEPIKILSLGCGDGLLDLNAEELISTGLLHNGLALVELSLKIPSATADYVMEQILGNDYYRIQPNGKLPLDDASPQGLINLRMAGKDCIYQFRNIIDEWISLLTPPAAPAPKV